MVSINCSLSSQKNYPLNLFLKTVQPVLEILQSGKMKIRSAKVSNEPVLLERDAVVPQQTFSTGDRSVGARCQDKLKTFILILCTHVFPM